MLVSEGEVTLEMVERIRKISIPTLNGGLRQLGFPMNFMKGVQNMRPGQRICGRAKTVRYVPYRPDLLALTNKDQDAPEYHAMAACGPGDVLVVETGGATWAAIGGEMVLLYLKMVKAEGLVTDGAVRDIQSILEYGYQVWVGNVTPDGRSPHIISLEQGGIINCGGTTVCPGDIVTGDEAGILCVPKQVTQKLVDWSVEHDRVETIVKQMILRDNVPPGMYYNARTFEKIQGKKDYEVV